MFYLVWLVGLPLALFVVIQVIVRMEKKAVFDEI